MKEAAYKGLVRPVLEYGSSVWDPHTHGLQEELEKVQNRAARFVTGNYVFETGTMTGILGQSLKKFTRGTTGKGTKSCGKVCDGKLCF